MTCDSCGEFNLHGYTIPGDTPLGQILGLESEHDTVTVDGHRKPIAETAVICEQCIEHLEEAAKAKGIPDDEMLEVIDGRFEEVADE